MSVIDIFNNFFRSFKPEPPSKPKPERSPGSKLSAQEALKEKIEDDRKNSPELYDYLSEYGCLDCGNSQFYQGPSGGMSTNIECVECGSNYNITQLSDTKGIAQRIK